MAFGYSRYAPIDVQQHEDDKLQDCMSTVHGSWMKLDEEA